MLLRVEQGKGRKDRYVMLAPDVLDLLRAWWREARPRGWLFPGRGPRHPGMTAPAAQALHCSPRSPFVRKVMIAAHELGIADGLTRVRNVVALHRPNDVAMAFNPLSRLPTLVVDRDGREEVLYASHVICSSLDARFGPGRLVPEGLDDRMTAPRQEALGDGSWSCCCSACSRG